MAAFIAIIAIRALGEWDLLFYECVLICYFVHVAKRQITQMRDENSIGVTEPTLSIC